MYHIFVSISNAYTNVSSAMIVMILFVIVVLTSMSYIRVLTRKTCLGVRIGAEAMNARYCQ